MPEPSSIESFFDKLRAIKVPSVHDLRALNVIELKVVSNALQETQAHFLKSDRVVVSKETSHV